MVDYIHTLEEEDIISELEDMQELEECDISDLNIGENSE